MSFATRKAGHVTSVFLNTSHYAESVTYTPVGGTGSAINAVVIHDALGYVEDDTGNLEAHRIRVYVDKDDVSSLARGDSVAVTQVDGTGTDTYRVDEFERQDEMMILTCVRAAEEEITDERFRGHRL